MKTKNKLAIAGGIIVTLFLVVLLLPTFQAIFYGLFVKSPSLWYWLIIGGSLTGALARFKPNVEVAGFELNLVAIGIGFTVVMALFVGPIMSGVYANEYMANQVQSNSEKLDTLPDTSKNHVRALPRSVADEYASSSMQKPQYKLTESDIAKVNGTYMWSYGVVPDTFFVSWFGNQNGALYVNMEQTSKEVTVEQTTFTNGRGQLFFDSYVYQSVLKSPLKSHNWKTTFNGRYRGQSFMAHSTTTHDWKFSLFPIPQPYTVPEHGSVEVMYPNGTINSMSPQEAHQSEMLDGYNYYPYHLTMFKVNSMKYRHGALNKWFWKEDVLAIADLPEGGNNWPLTVPTQMGDNETQMSYFVATEPTGSGNGVYEVWVADGQTGELKVQRYSNSQIGPQKAVNFVSRQPEVNRLSNAKVVAPVPIVKNGTLYWHAKVVPSSHSGLIYTAFVNAETGDVTLVDSTEKIYAFLNQEEVEEIRQRNNQTQNKSQDTMTVTVVVTNENGEITGTTNVTVPEGGSLEIKVDDSNKNNSTSNSTATG